jgi:hypothetical protein
MNNKSGKMMMKSIMMNDEDNPEMMKGMMQK